MDVSDEEVSDKNGCLSRSMTVSRASEIVFQSMYSDWRSVARGTCDNSAKEAAFTSLSSTSEMSQAEGGHPIVSCGSQHMTLHVPLTAETKDPINE